MLLLYLSSQLTRFQTAAPSHTRVLCVTQTTCTTQMFQYLSVLLRLAMSCRHRKPFVHSNSCLLKKASCDPSAV